MTLITNEQTTGLNLLDADELAISPTIISAVSAINSGLEEKITAEYFISHLQSNQFYLPNLLVNGNTFSLAFSDRTVPTAPKIEYIDNVAAKDGKPARITLSIGDDNDQMQVSYVIREGAKVKARDYVDKINPDQYSLAEIAKFLLSFIEPPIQINLPDGDYEVKTITPQEKSTIVELKGDIKVRLNSGCQNTVKKLRSKDGFIYELSEAGTLVTGLSIVQRGVPLVSENTDTSAKIGDSFEFLGIASLPTQHGSIHTALVKDSTGKMTYTKVNSNVIALVLTKLTLGKSAVAKIGKILTPGGQRKHYDVEWTR